MTFEELGVCEEIRRAIEELGFVQPMPVQEEVIPYLLGNRNDVIALAQTGTGKTAAFGIPVLQRIATADRDRCSGAPQAIVLAPTRELCLQIADDMKAFAKYLPAIHIEAVYGGASIVPQMKALRRGVQVIVATPGRLIDLMERGVAQLHEVSNVVLDEADEMLNMGFSESIDTILEGVPEERNTLLFSATMSREIERIAKGYLHDYKEIVVGSRNEGAEHVNHIYYLVNAKDKYLALKRIVDYYPKIYAIIFCRTKVETQEVADKLIRDGYNAESLHGDLSQQQRDLTMQKFRSHLTQLLVATDVAARGLDVDDLTHVINYGLPDDIENYTHRSGRTGRAGKKGTSISIIHTREQFKVRRIEREIGKEFVDGSLPSPHEICTKQLYKAIDEIEKIDVDEEQIAPFMQDINRHFEYFDKEDIIKKIVSLTFGRFLDYYADAPEIEKPSRKKEKGRRETGDRRQETGERRRETGDGRRETGDRRRERGDGRRETEKGFRKVFLNVGKADGFYAAEIMQLINRRVRQRIEVGHIDLLQTISYFEVPEQDARTVMRALDGININGRRLRCNDAEEGRRSKDESLKFKDERVKLKGESLKFKERSVKGKEKWDGRGERRDEMDGFEPYTKKSKRPKNRLAPFRENGRKNDWRQFFQNNNTQLKGEMPDFSEEGWARRRPKK